MHVKLTPFLVFFLLMAAGCDAAPPSKKGGGPGQKRGKTAHLVEVAVIQSQPLAHTAERTGTLTALRRVKIFNQEEGRIESLPVHEGDGVLKGGVLVRLDDRLLKTQLDKVRAERQQAESDLKRVQRLRKQKLSSAEKLTLADTALKVARAEEASIRTRLAYARIRAPFDGVVIARLADPGDVAPRHTHLLTLIDADSLVTEVAVSELLLPHFKVGDAARVRIDALGEAAYPGKILRIHPTVDPRTRQGVVEVRLTRVPPGASEGQLCRVTLTTPAITRRTAPFAALQRDREGTFVYLLKDGKAQRRPVVTGLRLGDAVDVLEGLAEGDRVVVRGFLGLTPGKTIKVVAAP